MWTGFNWLRIGFIGQDLVNKEVNLRVLRGLNGIGYVLDSSGSGYCPVNGFCEHGNERSDSLKGGVRF
jgi:hypothetical protein